MAFGCISNDPKKPVVFAYELSAGAYTSLIRLSWLYKQEPSKVIEILVAEKEASIFDGGNK